MRASSSGLRNLFSPAVETLTGLDRVGTNKFVTLDLEGELLVPTLFVGTLAAEATLIFVGS